MKEFDFNSFKASALEQIKNGASLFGKEGVFAPLLENILNAALEGEMKVHLREPQCQNGNCRNGKMDKQVQNPLGEVTVSTSLDKNASFSPFACVDGLRGFPDAINSIFHKLPYNSASCIKYAII